MGSLSEIVTVNILVSDASITQAAFNKILFTAYHTVGNERIRDYTDPTSIATDYANVPQVLAASAAFWAQSPNPGIFSIGRLLTAPTKAYTLTPTAQNSTLYRVIVNGLDADFTSDSTATLAEVCTGIAAAITALAVTGLTASGSSGTTVTLTATAGIWYSVQVDTPLITQLETTAAVAGLASELSGILAERNDCYGLVHQDKSEAVVDAVAAFCLSNSKIYGAAVSNPDVLTNSTTDVASDLKAAGNNRSWLMWSQEPENFDEMRMMSEEFPWNPGSRTWAFKKPAGAANADRFISGTGLTNLKAKNCNRMTDFGGNVVFFDGKMASGRYIDVQLAVDWITARMQEGIANVLVNAPDKVEYTDQGQLLITTAMNAVLQEGIRNKVIADDDNLSVTALPVAQQATNDRAQRISRGFNFSCRLSGAIHSAIINGVVST